jgi:rhodanese-related sulfurtransferase
MLVACVFPLRVAAQQRAAAIPEKKRTKLGLYVTAKDAYQMWRADPMKTVLLDVRTPAEYVFVGHAPMARNVPFEFWRDDVFPKDNEPVMESNPEFLARAKKVINAEKTVLVICRSGKRSARACDALAAAGYKKVYNVIDGFEGDAVDDRRSESYAKRTKNGWRNSRLPWTYELRKNLMYLPKE